MSSPKAIKTYASILEAARDILRQDGIERLSMDRVAERAGMSKGAVMYHFPTKRALQSALIQDYAEHMDEGLKTHEAKFKGRPEETLIPAYVEWFKSFCADKNGWASVGVQLLGQQAIDPELLKPISDWYQKLYDRIEALPENTRTEMLTAVMAMEGLFFVRKFGLGTIDAQRLEAVLNRLQATADAMNENSKAPES